MAPVAEGHAVGFDQAEPGEVANLLDVMDFIGGMAAIVTKRVLTQEAGAEGAP